MKKVILWLTRQKNSHESEERPQFYELWRKKPRLRNKSTLPFWYSEEPLDFYDDRWFNEKFPSLTLPPLGCIEVELAQNEKGIYLERSRND